jgi:hypothetical protein
MNERDASGPANLLDRLARPIYGYAGPIDGRIDFEIVRRLAEGEGNVVLVGPVENIDPVVLPRRPNVHFTGALGDAEVDDFVSGFDIVIGPFVADEPSEEAAESEPV